MSLRIQALHLHVVTDNGLYGVKLHFPDGLVVIRSDNSSGKSTCIQSIIYALGLEGMFGPGHDIPLPHVMTDFLEDNGSQYAVVESDVFMEIINHNSEVLTIQRTIKGTRDSKLISTWDGAAITNPSATYRQNDFFVRMEGAASRSAGFHNRLASFMGWQLPLITRYSGGESYLYMECIFPLFVVEQKRGWSRLMPPIPTHYQIPDVTKRSVEFIAGLDAYKNALLRRAIREEEIEIRSKWKAIVEESEYLVTKIGGVIQSLPSSPITEWPPTIAPTVLVQVGSEWVAISRAVGSAREELNRQEVVALPQVSDVLEQVQDSLKAAVVELEETEQALGLLFDNVHSERAQIRSIERQLENLRADLLRNKDVQRLRSLGSLATMRLSVNECPTCHQSVGDSLLPQIDRSETMSVVQNITFIEEQIKTLQGMKANSERILRVKEMQLKGLTERAKDLQSHIRALKATLVSPSNSPSPADIERRISLRARYGQLIDIEDGFDSLTTKLENLSGQWRTLQRKIRDLQQGDLSASDIAKLSRFEDLFTDQIVQYDVTSVSPGAISISHESYRPTFEGFDLDFDLSASDMIRCIWAYVHGLLELSRGRQTNHPGLLILDEPRQQEAHHISFASFLSRASTSGEVGQQVIFATSEEEDILTRSLTGIPHTYLSFRGKILKRLDS